MLILGEYYFIQGVVESLKEVNQLFWATSFGIANQDAVCHFFALLLCTVSFGLSKMKKETYVLDCYILECGLMIDFTLYADG